MPISSYRKVKNSLKLEMDKLDPEYGSTVEDSEQDALFLNTSEPNVCYDCVKKGVYLSIASVFTGLYIYGVIRLLSRF